MGPMERLVHAQTAVGIPSRICTQSCSWCQNVLQLEIHGICFIVQRIIHLPFPMFLVRASLFLQYISIYNLVIYIDISGFSFICIYIKCFMWDPRRCNIFSRCIAFYKHPRSSRLQPLVPDCPWRDFCRVVQWPMLSFLPLLCALLCGLGVATRHEDTSTVLCESAWFNACAHDADLDAFCSRWQVPRNLFCVDLFSASKRVSNAFVMRGFMAKSFDIVSSADEDVLSEGGFYRALVLILSSPCLVFWALLIFDIFWSFLTFSK